MKVDINDFLQEKECIYKNEKYSVRDNGAIMRHPKNENKPRPLDNNWTFGKSNPQNKYMHISSARVHIIVAIVFHGDPPTKQHIVDHIDTNRQNNRPENLRWFTKLENALNNPITCKRIIYKCGSIEEFLENPSLLRDTDGDYSDIAWMRTVTTEEASNSWERLKKWGMQDNKTPKGGKIGEWIFSPVDNDYIEDETNFYTASLTPNAVQVNWKTPCEYPCCPQEISETPINDYYLNLVPNKLFAINEYDSNTIVHSKAISEDKNTIWTILKADYAAVKKWYLTEITFNGDVFIHESLGSFFSQDGVEKRFTIEQGLEWNGEDSVDDYC